MTALHLGLSAVVVGLALLAGTFVAVDSERVAAPLLAVGALSFGAGAVVAAIGAVDVLLFGLF
jgi:hypothetical protein